MGNHKEKRSELDPPHSKRSREGVHTVLRSLEARTFTATENERVPTGYADSQLLHSFKHDEQAVRTARQLR